MEALDELKILDPACGSGAFPMGILQKIVGILEKIDPDNTIYLEQVVCQNPPEIQETVRKYLLKKNLNYVRKLGIIQKSIFGVDIQEMAVEISRLRFFLSLVVDEKVEDIEPLPNLDFKFVCANSLIDLPENKEVQTNMFDDEEKINELEKIREKYFTAHSSEKDDLKKKFKKIQDELWSGSCLFSIEHKKKSFELVKWDPFENHSASFFDPKWMFGVKNGFDIVIGNPPYVQLQKNGGELGKMYASENFESFAKTGDIYALFYERGNQLLNNSGNLCFITSNKWMRAGYGEKMRKYFIENTSPKLLIDLGPDVFETATVDTNILLFTKNNNTTEKNNFDCKACTIKEKLEKKEHILKKYIFKNSVQLTSFTNEAWIILNPAEQAIKEKIEKVGTPLKDWDIKINYGIKTGYNEAFIIDGKKKDEFIAKDSKSVEIIKPILRGKDIKRYYADFADKFLIASHNGYKKANGEKVEAVNMKNYPAIKEWLDSHWEKISKRGDKGKTPYNLRNCAYQEEFEKEKIVYGQFREGSYHFIKEYSFLSSNEYMITSNLVNLKYLIALMNSKLPYYYLQMIANNLGGKTSISQKSILIKTPIPQVPETQQKPFIDLVDKILEITSREDYDSKNLPAEQTELEKQIDEMVFELYGLNEEERETILSS